MRRVIAFVVVIVLVVVALTLALLGIAAGGLAILAILPVGPHLPEHNKIYVLPPSLPEGTVLVVAWRCPHGAPLREGPNHTFVFRFDRRGVACIGTRSWNGDHGESATLRYTITDARGQVPPSASYDDVAGPVDNSPTNELRVLEDIGESSSSFYTAYTLLYWGSADHLDRLAGETDPNQPDPYLPYLRRLLGPEYRPVSEG